MAFFVFFVSKTGNIFWPECIFIREGNKKGSKTREPRFLISPCGRVLDFLAASALTPFALYVWLLTSHYRLHND